MENPSACPVKKSPLTWIGLLIALLGLPAARWIAASLFGTTTLSAALWRESLMWVFVIALAVIIRKFERAPWSSVGIGTSSAPKSILWGLILTVICGVVGGVIGTMLHFRGGQTGESLVKLPLAVGILIVLRAGVAEELFYRGYAIERLTSLGLNRYIAAVIPLLIFGFAHLTNGWANVAIALALGIVLTVSYLIRRDLIANMIGHFLVDLTAVVLPRLVIHK